MVQEPQRGGAFVIVAADKDRAHDLVVVGSRWFGWGHHWTIKRERTAAFGVKQVLMHRDTGERGKVKSTNVWVEAWRVQRYLVTREDS